MAVSAWYGSLQWPQCRPRGAPPARYFAGCSFTTREDQCRSAERESWKTAAILGGRLERRPHFRYATGMASGRRLLGAALAGAGAGIVEQARSRREEQLLRLRRKWQVDDRRASEALQREAWDRQDARTAANQPLVPVMDESGVSRYQRRSDAIGALVPTKPGGGTERWEPVHDDQGNIVGQRSTTSGKVVSDPRAPTPEKEPRRPLLEDPLTGEFMGYGPTYDEWRAGQQADEQTAATDARRADALAQAEEAIDELGPEWTEIDFWNPFSEGPPIDKEMLADRIQQNPGVAPKELAQQMLQESGGEQRQQQPQGGGGRAYAGTEPPEGIEGARQLPDGRWAAPGPDGRLRVILTD